MKKNKNTTFKNNRLSFLFVFVNLVCFAAACLNGFLFLKSFNQALFRLGETPIATITFKYKTAQRKFMDRVVWDRLRQSSSVYNGDTIRTAPLSEATIWFSDGNVMQLYENTMAQVFLRDDGLNAVLDEGGVSVDSSSGENGVKLLTDGVSVQIESGSTMNAAASADNISLQVTSGTAVLSDSKGARQAVSAGDALNVSSAGETSAAPALSVVSPSPNVKILKHGAEPAVQEFVWKLHNTPEHTEVLLEISSVHTFETIEKSVSVTDAGSVSVELNDGVWYWRMTAPPHTGESKNGKITVIKSLPPTLIAPVVDYTYSYRTQKPPVRFLWTESAFATSYKFVIADNKELKNPVVEQMSALPSSIVSSLGAGKWYWQVTPYYTINRIGLKSPSSVNSFTIKQRADFPPPTPLRPPENGFVNTKNGASAEFSWKSEEEAAGYKLFISGNEDLSAPAVKVDVGDNYYISENTVKLLSNGKWYWGVAQVDTEGNVSQVSKARAFLAVDGDMIQRTVFPPDGYAVDSGRVQDVRFTWKTNIPFDTRIQISGNADFTHNVYDNVLKATALSGQNFAEGTYYWRIIADTDLMQLSSTVKTFSVLGSLQAPVCQSPADKTRAVIRPETPYEFQWSEVSGAGYYKVQLFKDGAETPVYERGFIDGTSIKIDMAAMDEGAYRWTVQSFAAETEMSSRRTGLLGESVFQMKKLKPVTLVSPAHKTQFDGVQAILNPEKAVWNSVEATKLSEFILTRIDGKEERTVMSIKNPDKTIQLDRLHSGDYRWTVTAETYDDLDVSAVKDFEFTVLPVTPLPAAVLQTPADRTVYNAEYIRQSRKIEFTWTAVKNASDYIFRIADSAGNGLLEHRINAGTAYTLEDLAVLDRGTFTWSVEAERRMQDDTILQEGIPVQAKFTVDLPKLDKPLLNDVGKLYGK